MEIQTQRKADALEVTLSGRLDAAWSEHVASAFEGFLRQGAHQVTLNLSGVSYISSAGIRVLVRLYRQLTSIHGSLRIAAPSEDVRSVLMLSGLDGLLEKTAGAAQPDAAANTTPATREFEAAGARFRLFIMDESAVFRGRIVAPPDNAVEAVEFPEDTIGVGLGAFGRDMADCSMRFGEFLAVGGTATTLPTDGSNRPDYLMSENRLIPVVQINRGLTAKGAFTWQAVFEACPETGAIGLSALIEACLDAVSLKSAAIAMVAETEQLVGAALRQSPFAQGANGDPFSFPAIRDTLSFTAEPAFRDSVSLTAGFAACPTAQGAELMRPMTRNGKCSGHFHAAAFPYRPLQKGRMDLRRVTHGLFEGHAALGILHLLNDWRDIHGVGESRFVRGACWFAPVSFTTHADPGRSP